MMKPGLDVLRSGLLCTVVLAVLFGGMIALAQEDDVAVLVEGNTTFAVDLYAAVRQNAIGNLLVSPYSVSQALAMTYAGARGDTAEQMADALSFTLPQPALHEAFSALNAALVARGNAEANPDTGETERALRIANGLWGEQTYSFSQAYMDLLTQYYGAGLQMADFINAPEEARQEINDWVAEQTEDRIQNIVPEGAVSSATRLVLANAIYFYGGWLSIFNPNATQDGDFFLLDGTTTTVPLMMQRHSFPYARGEGYQAIEFPYAGSSLTFTVIMPDEGQFEAFEESLDADVLNSVVSQLQFTDTITYLPKFEFEFGASLSDILQTMGMTDAFDPTLADFSGMVEGTPSDPLFISDVLHKAFISVDENGTEAAAATVVMMAMSAAIVEEQPVEVRIDHPFIFAIRDTQTGTLLFVGRVMNPSD
jgi:serpin B